MLNCFDKNVKRFAIFSSMSNSHFPQVVIERPSLRPDSKGTSKEAEEDVVMLYIAQLAALAVLLTAM